MAEWEKLDSLKTHRMLLNFIIVGLIAYLMFGENSGKRHAKSMVAGISTARVTASSGIKIRERPSANSNVVTTAAYDDKLSVLEQGPADKINGEQNYWFKVKSSGTSGYVWGPLISIK
jgi:hypothetical protein